MSFSKRQKQELKGKRLGPVQRRILWLLGNGELTATTPGELAKISGTASLDTQPYVYTTPQIAAKVYSLQRDNLSNKARASTNRACHSLHPLLLFYSSFSFTSKREVSWGLTPLGRAVMGTFQEELANNKRIRWNSKKLRPFSSDLERTYSEVKSTKSYKELKP